MKKIILTSLLSISFSMTSQNEVQKRNNFKLEIAANETQQYVADIPEGPYFVKDKILQIYCGEKIFVECEIESDSISKMKVVEKNNFPERTIVIEFTQNSENRKEISTELWVKNPFSKTLKYEAMMFTPNRQEWRSTSILPIMPNLQNFEHWPHAIVTLVLGNWRVE
ncbi:hypothetical protein [Flavobacterium stagni]|uniref:Uncharacterized protein n=1 Tax=Flavobacterium stagni TaxID=2506421 RepID=A0A4Q1K2D1_9FLAO|nr:hypothetical protein [Flavobacterium stagni]RXR18867.1 hypothetical protein EQG61_13630 [Flavobacterium stagni]